MIFLFRYFEITPTPEEISQIVDLPLAGRAPLAWRTMSRIGFLWFLGLIVGLGLQRVYEGCVKLYYLFKRICHRERYDRFLWGFYIFRVDWKWHKAIIFNVSFLGMMIFPKKGWVNINLLPIVIYMFRGHTKVTIVPMILVEIFPSLSFYSRRYNHFKESNMWL